MRNFIRFCVIAVLSIFAMSCSNLADVPGKTEPAVNYQKILTSRDIATDIVDNNGVENGITNISVTENGFETAISKKTGDLTITFLIVNPTMDNETIQQSVYYLNSTKALVSDMNMIEWYLRCHNAAINNELITEYGYANFNGEQVYLFTLAYNDYYVELFL